MKATEARKQIRAGKLCPCGARAVRYSCGIWSCLPCIEKDRAIWATDRIRGTCGFPGPPQPYRVTL